MNISEILRKEFSLKNEQVENVIKLIDEGNTIPSIARYRKEMTGEMSDVILRQFNDRLTYLRNLQSRKEDVQRIIEEQGKLTEEIIKNLAKSNTLQEVEDIYAPFKQKKRTRATIAKEKGLENLALEHTNKKGEHNCYVRVTSTDPSNPESGADVLGTKYLLNGSEISKADAIAIADEKKMESTASSVYNINFKNIISIG